MPRPDERITFKLLDLGEGDDVEARRLFATLCARRQALSPTDRDLLAAIVEFRGEMLVDWLPAEIALKETTASIFGTLLRSAGDPDQILRQARPYLATATDVLRLLAAYSGADPALQGDIVARGGQHAGRRPGVPAQRPRRIDRFRVRPLSRRTRRGILALLDEMDGQRLIEDMLRHRSYWVWVGEFLHPFDYAERFRHVALAFSVLRGTRPGDDDVARPLREAARAYPLETTANGSYVYRTYNAQLEQAADHADSSTFTRLLAARPGELARHLDQALRLALAAGQSPEPVIAAYMARAQALATPVLATLSGHLSTRDRPAPIRLFWPKGQIAKGVSAPDQRLPLPAAVLAPLRGATTNELLRRFAARPHVMDGVVDAALTTIVAPFNERTASRAAVALPRGSRLPIPEGEVLRLFLHWCQPPGAGRTTDLDLSVAFYDAAWTYVGVCSYYQLTFNGRTARKIALSAGDLRDAPGPEGATEFVDLHRERARTEGIRYAVMVVNSYAGLPFSALERAYAGLMSRGNADGQQFDPRTVLLKFELQGDNGVYLPMVVDIAEGVVHWLDVYSTGQFEFNNVETSRGAIRTICPEMLAYFGSGLRPSLHDIALLHAAARCATIFIRGDSAVRRYSRRPDEDLHAFHARVVAGEADDERGAVPVFREPVFACLFHGDLTLPVGSAVYALFRDRQTMTMAASDLLS